jgi:hypothetical protein
MAFKQEVNVPLLLTIGIISGLMVLVIVIGMQAWYQSEEIDETAIKAQDAVQRSLLGDAPEPTFAELKQGQQLALEAKPPHWIDDKKKDRTTIPIGEAMSYLQMHGGNLP